MRKEDPGCTSSCPSKSNFLGVPTAALAAETQTVMEKRGGACNNQHMVLADQFIPAVPK